MELKRSKGFPGYTGARGDEGEQAGPSTAETEALSNEGKGQTEVFHGDYEENPVDQGQQFEIDSLLDSGPYAKKPDKSRETDDMIAFMEGKTPGGGEKSVEKTGPGKEEEKRVEQKADPKEREVKKEEKKPEASTSTDEEGDDPVTALRNQVLELTSMLIDLQQGKPPLAKKLLQPEKKEGESEVKTPTAKAEEVASTPLPQITAADFGIDIDDATFEKVFESKEALNEVLTVVAAKTMRTTAERLLMALPKIINKAVSTQVQLSLLATKFFADNPDLAKQKKFVGFVSNQLTAAHPEWSAEEIFKELGDESRKRLGLKAKAMKKDEIEQRKRPSPTFARAGAARGQTPATGGVKGDLSEEQSQIEDMINLK